MKTQRNDADVSKSSLPALMKATDGTYIVAASAAGATGFFKGMVVYSSNQAFPVGMMNDAFPDAKHEPYAGTVTLGG